MQHAKRTKCYEQVAPLAPGPARCAHAESEAPGGGMFMENPAQEIQQAPKERDDKRLVSAQVRAQVRRPTRQSFGGRFFRQRQRPGCLPEHWKHASSA